MPPSVTFQVRPRVLLADDYVALLTAWRRLLEPSCEVVGSVRNGRALLEAATELSPDVIVADLSMPEVNGLDACRQIKLASPQTKVVLVTAGGDEWVARAACRAGASAFVLKHSAADDLLTAIQSAMLGDTYCTPMVRMDDRDLH
jgi:DNA-binding NarL/FixJ family response regulator